MVPLLMESIALETGWGIVHSAVWQCMLVSGTMGYQEVARWGPCFEEQTLFELFAPCMTQLTCMSCGECIGALRAVLTRRKCNLISSSAAGAPPQTLQLQQ